MVVLPWLICAIAVVLMIVLLIPRQATPETPPQPGGTSSARPRVLSVVLPTRPEDLASSRQVERPKTTLRDRLMHAGLYQESSFYLLRLMRFVFLGLIVFGGYLCSTLGLVSLQFGLMIGLIGGILATIAPGFYLDFLKHRRQVSMQRALPDALDIIVVSLEGGLAVTASFQRVSSELASSHPLLSAELTIAEREMKMGRSLGEAISSMASRFDLDELRSMASVIQQSERYGAGVTRAFRVFSDGLRERRRQQAEERAHKAAVKLIFPTVMFIFPAMFVVILAPAIFRFLEMIRTFNASFPKP